MELFNKDKKGFIGDVIRCDEPSYLVWKWQNEDRENAIRWGSTLRVKDGEVAVFVYKQKDGVMQDYIVGPYDQIIKTANFPVLANIVGLGYDGDTPFQAEVYFINLARIVQTKFGVPYFNVYDPRFLDFGVPVAVRGTITFSITNYQQFIKLNRLVNFDLEDFQNQIRDVVTRYVKDVVANAPAQHNIPLIQIETKLAEMNDVIEFNLKERLFENFGVTVSGVDLSAIELDETSVGYQTLLSVTKDIAAATITAEMQAKIKDIEEKQHIEAVDYEEKLRIQREEAQYAQHKETQSANLSALQIEKQAEVGIAGAEALGKMGEHGAGDIDLGSGDSGFNMASIMASMAVGGAVGQNLAGVMNGMMQPNNLPPIPQSSYYVVMNDQAVGPYPINVLSQMNITSTTYVYKQGMKDWTMAGEVDELKGLFKTDLPPLPKK